MRKSKRHEERTRPDPRRDPKPESEEDLQPRDPREAPHEPQDPVNPGADLAT